MLTKQIDALLTRLIESENKTVIAAYEAKIAKLEQDKLILSEKAASCGQTRAPFAQMFELASQFLANPWKIWESGRFDLQRMVLKLAFSERFPYCRKTGF